MGDDAGADFGLGGFYDGTTLPVGQVGKAPFERFSYVESRELAFQEGKPGGIALELPGQASGQPVGKAGDLLVVDFEGPEGAFEERPLGEGGKFLLERG